MGERYTPTNLDVITCDLVDRHVPVFDGISARERHQALGKRI
jgi:hypothetical protein